MERTSSLDLFRGSDAFTSLAFLDGQELSHEANSGNIAAEGLQPSQAIPARMPVNSLHLAAPMQRPSKMLHTSRLAAGFSAWPQTASGPYPSVAAMQQPARARHTFLPFGSPASQHVAGTVDCQADSCAALLADDTALGFADDCFRRESDLFLSQDRAVAAETAYHIALPSNDDYSSPSDVSPATQSAAAESMPHDPTVGKAAPVTVSAHSAPCHLPAIAAASQEIASTQTPIINSFHNLSPSALKDSNLAPAAPASMTAADASASGAEPQAAHDQLQTADHHAGQMQSDTPNPDQVEPQTSTDNGQAHTAQVSASSSLVTAPTARDIVANNLGACKSMKSKLVEPLLRPNPLPAQMSPQAGAPGDAPDCCIRAPLEGEHPHATDLEATPAEVKADLQEKLHDTAVGQAASQGCQLQNASHGHSSISQQQKLGSGETAGGRPKLAVQDYQLPLLQSARDVSASGPQTQEDTRQAEQPGLTATVSQAAHTSLPQNAPTSQHRGDMSGVCFPPWSAQLHLACWESILWQNMCTAPSCLLTLHIVAAILEPIAALMCSLTRLS